VLLWCVPGHEQGRIAFLRNGAPRGHLEAHHRPVADPRRAVRLPRIPRLRGQARLAARRREEPGQEQGTMTEASTLPKPKKSVALSGTAAGNTALCTDGRSGNERHGRGYDVQDLATSSCCVQVAQLRVNGERPIIDKLNADHTKLRCRRGLPAAVTEALVLVPVSAVSMDVGST